MKLTAQIKLLPTPQQAVALRQTLQQANAACQFVSDTAWEKHTFRQYDLHHQCYQAVHKQFGLSAQVTVRAIAKRAGVPVFLVDPKNTSRTCPACGHVDKANRVSQPQFSFGRCGFAGLAAHIAAINIGRPAAVNPPIVARDEAKAVFTELRQSAVTSQLL